MKKVLKKEKFTTTKGFSLKARQKVRMKMWCEIRSEKCSDISLNDLR